jgi:Domain of unknown function (DUF3471)
MKKLMIVLLCCFASFGFLKAQAIQKPLTAVSTSLNDYCGVYKMAENPYVSEVKIDLKDGKLVSSTPNDEEVIFEYVEEDTFFISPINATAVFTREKGIVKSIKVAVQGKEVVGEKN